MSHFLVESKLFEVAGALTGVGFIGLLTTEVAQVFLVFTQTVFHAMFETHRSRTHSVHAHLNK